MVINENESWVGFGRSKFNPTHTKKTESHLIKNSLATFKEKKVLNKRAREVHACMKKV